jgi:excisionase family DNA binding protein
MDTPALIIGPDEAAELLKVAKGTLAKWRVSGLGPKFVRLGRKVGYRRSDLDDWISQNTRAHTGECSPARHEAEPYPYRKRARPRPS